MILSVNKLSARVLHRSMIILYVNSMKNSFASREKSKLFSSESVIFVFVVDPSKNKSYYHDESFLDTEYYPKLKTQLEFKNTQCVQQILQGGAIMNAMWCLEYAPACYVKYPKKTDGGGSIWDYAASVCIYNELGLNATDYNLKELNLNPQGTTYMNEFGVLISTLLEKTLIK